MCKGNFMSLKITDLNQKDLSKLLRGDASQGFIDFLTGTGRRPDPKTRLVGRSDLGRASLMVKGNTKLHGC